MLKKKYPSYFMRKCVKLEQNMQYFWNQQPKVNKKQVFNSGNMMHGYGNKNIFVGSLKV